MRASSAAVLLAALLAGIVAAAAAAGPRRPLGKNGKQPNIILLLTDDQDAVMGGDWHMPKLRQHLAQGGINFTNYIANFAVCCPSRTTILTGECAHNSGVVGAWGETLGGFHRFTTLGLEQKTVPLLLQKAGYRTGIIGKYLNQYDTSLVHHVAPGWDRWFVMTSDIGSPDYYDWVASDEGVLRRYSTDDADYSTDVLTEKAVEYIHQHQQDQRPFFLYLTPYATHRPHIPAPRHKGAFKGLKIPRVPSWNESDANIAKKASFLRNLPPIDHETADALDFEYQTRAETLLAVDDMIEAVIQALDDIGELDNTFIFYAPDNGFKLGHHRIPGKMSAYENDIRLPFYVRGPGIKPGQVLPHMVGNVDFAPTWVELAGLEDPLAATRDGISLVPILLGQPDVLENPEHHRVGILIEKPATNGGKDKFVSILTPVRDVLNDVFDGYRPRLLPNGSWPQQVLDWELQGHDLPDDWVKRVEGSSEFYGGLGFEQTVGFQIYLNMTKEAGLTPRGVILGLNEDFPLAYYGLRYQDRHHKYKYRGMHGGSGGCLRLGRWALAAPFRACQKLVHRLWAATASPRKISPSKRTPRSRAGSWPTPPTPTPSPRSRRSTGTAPGLPTRSSPGSSGAKNGSVLSDGRGGGCAGRWPPSRQQHPRPPTIQASPAPQARAPQRRPAQPAAPPGKGKAPAIPWRKLPHRKGAHSNPY